MEDECNSKLIYFLVDGSSEYEEYSVEMNNLLIDIVPKIINPGDRLVLSWIGKDSLSSSIFFDEKVLEVPYPIMEPFTETLPTRQILIESGEYYSSNAKLVATESAQQTQTALDLYATQTTNEFFCEQNAWLTETQRIYSEWIAEQNRRIDEFTSSFEATLKTTDHSWVNGPISNIYESLYLSAQFMQEEAARSGNENPYEKKIVIFSSLYDVRDFDEYLGPSIDFTETDIIIVLQDCKYLYDDTSNCREKVNHWAEIFKQYNPNSVSFISGYNIEENLIDQINGR